MLANQSGNQLYFDIRLVRNCLLPIVLAKMYEKLLCFCVLLLL